MLSNHLFIVFAIDHYNPLGVIRSLGEKGIRPIFIAVKGKVALASKSKYIMKCHYVNTIEEGYKILISEYGNFGKEKLPFLYCTDDHCMGYIDEYYDELKNRFFFFNAGESGRINKYIDKYEILKLAKECDINIPETKVCKKNEIPDDISFPIITKSISPNVGGWKSDVFICNTITDIREAYKKIKAHTVLLQSYIEKKNELEYYGFSINHGNDVFISIAANYLYLIPGYYSPYMKIFKPPFLDVQKKISNMIKSIRFEGIFSVEFLIDEKDKLYFLEVNFRNATWSYSSTIAGMNLPYLWAKGMLLKNIADEEKVKFEPFTAMVEPIDYGKRVDTGKISFIEWAKNFKEAKCTYYYNKEDMAPFMVLYNNLERLK